MVRGKHLSSDEREMVMRVMKFFENEKNNSSSRLPVDQVMKRTSLATGVSQRTLRKIKHEVKNKKETDILVPVKRGNRRLNIDDAMILGIRRIINDFYTVKHEEPTLRKVLAVAKNDLNFPGGINTLWRLLQEKGYRFEKSISCELISHGTPEICTKLVNPMLDAPTNSLTVTQTSSVENAHPNTELIECKTENFYDQIDNKSFTCNENDIIDLHDSSTNTNNPPTSIQHKQNWLPNNNIQYEYVPRKKHKNATMNRLTEPQTSFVGDPNTELECKPEKVYDEKIDFKSFTSHHNAVPNLQNSSFNIDKPPSLIQHNSQNCLKNNNQFEFVSIKNDIYIKEEKVTV